MNLKTELKTIEVSLIQRRQTFQTNRKKMKEQIRLLAERNRMAKTQEEKEAVAKEMETLKNQDPKAFTEALESLIRSTAKDVNDLTIAEKMGEATKMISMAYIAKTYFGKSRSWLAHKINGNIVNGKASSFTEEERNTFKHALADMSQKLGSLGVSL